MAKILVIKYHLKIDNPLKTIKMTVLFIIGSYSHLFAQESWSNS